MKHRHNYQRLFFEIRFQISFSSTDSPKSIREHLGLIIIILQMPYLSVNLTEMFNVVLTTLTNCFDELKKKIRKTWQETYS